MGKWVNFFESLWDINFQRQLLSRDILPQNPILSHCSAILCLKAYLNKMKVMSAQIYLNKVSCIGPCNQNLSGAEVVK